MSLASEAKAWIQHGIAGGNKGFDLGLPRLQRFIPGFQKATTYLVGGESGTGKSAFADQTFTFSPYESLKQQGRADKLRVLKFSLEIEKRAYIVKAACNRLYRQKGILIDINTVLSRGENHCSQELYDLVCEQLDFFEELEDVLIINDVGSGPTGINKAVLAYMHAHGKVTKKTVDNGDGPFEVFDYYTPDDPEVIVSPQVDHVGLLRGEKDLGNKKAIIDKLSTEYAIPWRNNYGCSPVEVQQLNRTLSSADRAKIDRVRPQLSDFKETANTQEDANVVLALFSPQRYSIPTWEDYKIDLLKDRFRGLSILKNRDGEADKILGLRFLGEAGYFNEMPKPAELTTRAQYDALLTV